MGVADSTIFINSAIFSVMFTYLFPWCNVLGCLVMKHIIMVKFANMR